MQRALVLVFVVSACTAPLVPPPCPGSVPTLTTDGFVNEGRVLVDVTVDDGLATVRFAELERDDALELTFPVQEAPGIIEGESDLDVGFGKCTGEGCDEQLWVLARDGARSLEVGRVNFLEDDGPPSASADETHLGVVYPAGALACDDGDPDTAQPAALSVRTDDGELMLAPGDSREVTIDGAPWRVLAGPAARRESFQGLEPCADCPGPGLHANTFATGILYRLD